ncbi:MAG: hypothetical protein KAS29_16065 [Bacteroidales bacterium]|nr:hypothetical protein [Bacteroidales bacterium]
MKKLFALAFTLGLTLLFVLGTAAQDKKEYHWLVTEEVVKPDMVEQYVEVSQELLKLCKEENFPYHFEVWSRDYFTFSLWYPLEELNDIIKIEDAWDGIVEKFGEENFLRFQECITSQFSKVMITRLDLSYIPENLRLNDEEVKYCKWQELYIKKGSEKKMEELLTKANSVLKEKGYEDPSMVGEAMIGYEQPLYFSWSFGKDKIDFLEQERKIWELAGEEWKSINEELVLYLLRIDESDLWYHKDLSHKKEAL